MKKTPVIALVVVFSCVALCMCAGCIGSDPIVGVWEFDAIIMDMPITFTADGKGVMDVLGPLKVNLVWKKNDDNTYSIGVAEGKDEYSLTGNYTLSEDKKKLSDGFIVFTKKN